MIPPPDAEQPSISQMARRSRQRTLLDFLLSNWTTAPLNDQQNLSIFDVKSYLPMSESWTVRLFGYLTHGVPDIGPRHIGNSHEPFHQLPVQFLQLLLRHFLGPEIGYYACRSATPLLCS